MNFISQFQEFVDELNEHDVNHIDSKIKQFSNFVDKGIHISLANNILESILNGNHTALPSTNGKYLLLLQDKTVSLATVRYSRTTRDILWSPENFVQQSISKTECTLNEYSSPKPVDEAVFDSSKSLTMRCTRRISNGDYVRKRPEDVIDIGGLKSEPIDFVRLSLPPQGNFEWAFARDTLSASSITTTLYGESNLLGIIDLMAQVGNVRSGDLLVRLLDHPLHFVRWRALRSLVSLRKSNTLSYLEQAARDPHPEVRTAAARSLVLVRSRLQEQVQGEIA